MASSAGAPKRLQYHFAIGQGLFHSTRRGADLEMAASVAGRFANRKPCGALRDERDNNGSSFGGAVAAPEEMNASDAAVETADFGILEVGGVSRRRGA